jgi:hypothetical protein
MAAAWLHDVGYAPPLNKLGFHPVDGARYVRQLGRERLASLVAHHSSARFEAEERGLVDALAEFEPEDGPLLDALTYADMTTGPAGQRVDLEERIAEVLERYPRDDPVHRAISRSHPRIDGWIFSASRSPGSTNRTSLVSLLVASWPPSIRVVKQIEHCWRTSPSS